MTSLKKLLFSIKVSFTKYTSFYYSLEANKSQIGCIIVHVPTFFENKTKKIKHKYCKSICSVYSPTQSGHGEDTLGAICTHHHPSTLCSLAAYPSVTFWPLIYALAGDKKGQVTKCKDHLMMHFLHTGRQPQLCTWKSNH